MFNRPLVCAIAALFVLSHTASSSAEEKKSGSFFAAFQKNKKPAKSGEPAKAKSGLAAFFGGKSENPEKAKETSVDAKKDGKPQELTEEEKKMVERAARSAQAPVASSEPRQTVQLPPGPQRLRPEIRPAELPTIPKVPVVPGNPNKTLVPRVPQAPNRFATPAARPAKISSTAPSAPNKKQP